MNNILVICVGNICRSPVAEGMLKAQLPQSKVWSAGLGAMVGHPADATAAEVALENGVDISAHRAQQVASWMLGAADLVLVMEASHKRQLEQQFPLARGKIYRLGEWGPDGPFDIADPYQKSRASFEATHGLLAAGVASWTRRLLQLA
ncbi:MAG: low molecular weight phosphotyrosine protein phosphatase [Ramlibacter sp.]|nr:low molecular weight phosphotyrosine protein phosphatase [Ramlibacter sp.]